MRERVVRVELVGGIGNQLFQYFAGKSLADLNQVKLQLDTSLIGVNGTFHRSSLEEFDLGLEFKHSRFKRLINRTIFGRINRRFLRTSRLYRRLYRFIYHYYQSHKISFDEDLLLQTPPITISGYFQTDKYFNYLTQKNMTSLELLSPSDWFTDLERMATTGTILAIHIRRGDYVGLKESFGLLSRVYYVAALQKANELAVFDKVWVFSDDINLAKGMLHGLENLYFVVPPADSNPVESLILMSKCSGMVISNSTFAWWASFLSGSTNVIYPYPWFKSAPYSEDLINPKWVALQSDWED